MSKIIKFILIIIVILAGILLIRTIFSYLGKRQLESLGLETDQIQQLLQEKGLDSISDISKIEPIDFEKMEGLGLETDQIQQLLQGKGLGSISDIIKSTDFEKKEQTYKEFVSSDGKLKLSYPSGWLEIEGEDLNSLQEKAGSHDLKFLFSAQNLNLGKFSQILVHEGSFDSQEGFEQIIETMKETNQEQGWDMQIINLEVKDEEVVFEAQYQKTDRYSLRSKEKIILIETAEGEKKLGLIAFIVFKKDWSDFREQANFVINSVIINK